MSHVFTHGSSQAVLRTGRRASYSPSTGGETRTPGEPGEQFHQKKPSRWPCLLLTDLQAGLKTRVHLSALFLESP